VRVPESLLFPFRQEGRPGVGYRLDIPLFSNDSRQFLFLMRSGITDALLWEPETLRTGIRWGESLESMENWRVRVKPLFRKVLLPIRAIKKAARGKPAPPLKARIK